MYSKAAIIEFFNHAGWGVNNIENDELQTNCPDCRYINFYFNMTKLVGFCHKAKCKFHMSPPNLEELEELAGFKVNEFHYRVRVDDENPVHIAPEVKLPGEPVLFHKLGKLFTVFPPVVEYLHKRGIDNQTICNLKMTYDGTRVYVPVFNEEKLINYVGRDLTGTERKKYLYASGAKTSEWLFGWDEAKLWDRLTLVENTFVSIALRNKVNCSTNFGSSLSDVQILLVAKSNIQTVAILWDEGTHKAANKTVKKLREHGVHACYAIIKGQPDDYDTELICDIANDCHDAARNGIRYIDPFGISRELLHKDVQDKKKERRIRNG
jgi:hypothetical protein